LIENAIEADGKPIPYGTIDLIEELHKLQIMLSLYDVPASGKRLLSVPTIIYVVCEQDQNTVFFIKQKIYKNLSCEEQLRKRRRYFIS